MIELVAAIWLLWDTPSERVDGTPLDATEIHHYEMYRDGSLYGKTDTSSQVEMEVNADGTYTVRAVDTDGQAGDFSNEVAVKIKGKARAPGQLSKWRY